MKKLLSLCLALIAGLTFARADEGMWLLKIMERQHLEDSLRRAGLQMPASELYSETSPSLRECIGIFGGGCTGEIVSPDGLVFTNHHCGFSYVHEMSDTTHNYMKNGYFAHNRSEELRTPESLTFTFILAIRDVTAEVNAAAERDGMDEFAKQSQSYLEPLAEEMLKKSEFKKKKGVSVHIVPYFGGNEFYIIYDQTFEDVRLVANPPYNVGQFGGNTDNWMWPRHNADFAVFRIYADKNGNPAPYSEKNVPLQCKKFLPISLKGMQMGDYAMIMGFPGSTSRYLTAAQVKYRTDAINAPIVLAGNPLLDYYKRLMDQSDELRLLLEDQYFSWGNSIKNFGGMNEAVEKTHLVAEKQAEEQRVRDYAAKVGKPEYAEVIDRIAARCEAYKDTVYDGNLATIALRDKAAQAPVNTVNRFVEAVRAGKEKEIKAAGETLQKAGFNLSSTELEIDHNKALLLAPYFIKNKKLNASPEYLTRADYTATIDSFYTMSVFADSARLADVIARRDTTALLTDVGYRVEKQEREYYNTISEAAYAQQSEVLADNKIYVRALCEMYNYTKAPDANFTLRMTYGHVNDLYPRNAVHYDWQTTLEGMFEKESATESDYFVNDTLRTLYEAHDFGRYALPNGKLPTCFLTDNDITGGNSGSPVMNARGELIGLAFDGNIESLSSDLKFNPTLQRCVNVDVRFVLFILDKFGHCQYLFDELDLR